jgi:hypothetical protein
MLIDVAGGAAHHGRFHCVWARRGYSLLHELAQDS